MFIYTGLPAIDSVGTCAITEGAAIRTNKTATAVDTIAFSDDMLFLHLELRNFVE